MKKLIINGFSLILLITFGAVHARIGNFLNRTSSAHRLLSQRLLSLAAHPLIDPLEKEVPIVVLDCCGTVGDPCSSSPVEPFRATYAAEGVGITEEEARAPMGIGKRDHIKQVPVLSPDVAARWQEIKGVPMTNEDVDRMYARYKPLQVKAVHECVTIIPGAVEAAEKLRLMGIEYIGGTTGFFREAAEAFRQVVAKEGFHFNNIVCTDDTGGKGRPAKGQTEGGYEMLLESMNRAGVYEPRLVIKAGDSEGDIEEGRRIAQVYGEPVWTIGFYMTGTYFPFSKEEIKAMDPAELAHHITYAQSRLGRANILIPSIKELPEAVEWIMELNALGIRPSEYNELHDQLSDKDVR